MKRAVFLDRDGVINALVYNPEENVFDSPYHLDQFRLLPGSAQAIKVINDMGLLAIMVSNQPGVAKGKCSPQTMEALTEKMRAELATTGARLDAVYYCYHHPEGVVKEYRMVCSCRKPLPGMLLKAASDFALDLSRSYLVGDSPKDIQAGQAAGCKTFFIGEENSLNPPPDFIVADLLAATRQIYQEEKDGYLHR